jgi:mRNA interferase HigB
MRVISKRTLREFWEKHSTAQTGLVLWYQRICDSNFTNFNDLRQLFPSADLVGNFTVFNVSGNNYRLITYIDYEYQIVWFFSTCYAKLLVKPQTFLLNKG